MSYISIYSLNLTLLFLYHTLQKISSPDMIILMDKGHVKWVGSSIDLSLSSYSAFSPLNELDTVSHICGHMFHR